MAFCAERWLAVAALGALASCAAVAPPQGGPRDVTPPRLISSVPDSAARNVKLQSVRLVFSEYVQVKDLSKNLLITPQLAPDNNYKLREDRNSVTLLFDKPLADSTTYSFNFRNAVVDITESLPAKNAQLSFSTGAVLDSGVVRGTVTDLLTAQPIGEASVALFRLADTAGVRRGRPYYLTRTDKKGAYNLGFLRSGTYRLYAFVDKNTNNRFDEGEHIGYLPAPVAVGPTPLVADLQLTRPDRRPPLLTTQTPGPTALRIAFNEGLATAALAPLPAPDPARTPAPEAVQLTDGGRNLLLFKSAGLADGRYLLTATDSSGNVARDTLAVRFPVPGANARKAPEAVAYTVEGNPRSVYRQGRVRLQFPVPMLAVAGRPVGTLVEDSVRRRPLRLPADATFNAARTELTVMLNTQAKNRVELVIDSTALLPVTGQALRWPRRPLRFELGEVDPDGTLFGTIKTERKSFVLQLLNDKYEVVQALASPVGKYRFEHVPPGKYRLRVLVDANGDGRWQGGNPDLITAPEPVVLLPKVVQLRSNFEIEEPVAF
ncbi:Ig-like domain-containing protein [Hymenobacter nivis]|nr:Ig-like domain-containing protein [Hymenobacter nivis]